MKILKINFDAACRSVKDTDMPMGIGIHANLKDRELEYMYFNAGLGTVSTGEWIACIEALKMGLDLCKDFDKVELYGDSQLIVNQFNGIYAVKHERLQKLKAKALIYLDRFPLTKFGGVYWNRREFNKRADELSKMGLGEEPVNYLDNLDKF